MMIPDCILSPLNFYEASRFDHSYDRRSWQTQRTNGSVSSSVLFVVGDARFSTPAGTILTANGHRSSVFTKLRLRYSCENTRPQSCQIFFVENPPSTVENKRATRQRDTSVCPLLIYQGRLSYGERGAMLHRNLRGKAEGKNPGS